MEMALFMSECKTAVAEAVTVEAQAWLTGQALAMILHFHFVRRRSQL
jgi:hypothetical protein